MKSRLETIKTKEEMYNILLITETKLMKAWEEIKKLEKENGRLETQIESFANEFGYNVNEIIK